MQIGLIAEGASELRILKHIIGRYLGTEHDINEINLKQMRKGLKLSLVVGIGLSRLLSLKIQSKMLWWKMIMC